MQENNRGSDQIQDNGFADGLDVEKVRKKRKNIL
jgi:hypothetical protein